MHIAGVPVGSLGPSLTWGQVWEGKESACLPALQELPVLSSGQHFWEAAGLAPAGDSLAPATPRMFQALTRGWVEWLGACPHCKVAAPAQDTRTAVSDGKDSRGLVLWVANWANRGARDSPIYPASGSKARARP